MNIKKNYTKHVVVVGSNNGKVERMEMNQSNDQHTTTYKLQNGVVVALKVLTNENELGEKA